MRPSLTAPIASLVALVLPLAACDRGPTVAATNASAAEVKEKVAAAGGGDVTIEPGRWEGTYVMHELDMPGLPPQAKEAMKKQMGAARTFVNCVTEEDVKEQKALYTGDDDKDCTYDHFTLGGGRIDAAMACNRGQQGKMAMTMTGNYSPQSYHMDMAARTETGSPTGGMTMKMSIDAKRVGACLGTKDEL